MRRLDWVDVARGIGILLVVYGHALRAQITSGQADDGWHASLQDDMIYAFHMHLFFFLAGLFVAGSISKGTGRFIENKLKTIAYPYVLWSLVSVLLGTIAGGATNHEMDLTQLTPIWYKPVYQYWFLYALFICEIVALAIRADHRVSGILILLSAAGLLGFLTGMISIAADYFPFFFGGVVLAPLIIAKRGDTRVLACVAIVGSFLFFMSFWQFDVIRAFTGEAVVSLVRGILGVATIIAVSMMIGARARWLAIIGTASMAIYVLHTIFSAGLRIVLTAIGVQSPILLLIACSVIGLVVPIGIWWTARRSGMLTVFGLGSDVSRTKVVRA